MANVTVTHHSLEEKLVASGGHSSTSTSRVYCREIPTKVYELARVKSFKEDILLN